MKILLDKYAIMCDTTKKRKLLYGSNKSLSKHCLKKILLDLAQLE